MEKQLHMFVCSLKMWLTQPPLIALGLPILRYNMTAPPTSLSPAPKQYQFTKAMTDEDLKDEQKNCESCTKYLK